MINQNKMGTHKMLPLIITMALPSMFSMLVQALYNIVDSYFVGLYSQDGLSAVSLAFPMQNLIIAFSVGTAIGAGSLISRKLGEGDPETATKTANTGLVLSVLTWIIFLIIGITCSEGFYRLFESNEDIISMGTSYLSIVTSFSIFCFIQIYFEKTLQATGNMVAPMIMQLVGALVNMALDPLFIFGIPGFMPAMGVTGAAIATIIGQFCACVIAVVLIIVGRSRSPIDFAIKNMKLDKESVINIYKVGFPAIIMNAIGTVMLMAMNAILASFSTAAYTVYGVYFKLQSFVFMPLFGLSNGIMPILGYNYGAKNKKRFTSCLKISIIIALGINIVGTIVFWMVPSDLLMIFNATDEILEIGVPALQILSIGFPLAAVAIIISTVFQATGFGFYSMVSSILRQLLLLVPLAYILSSIEFSLIWWSSPIADLATVTIVVILFIRLYRNKIATLEFEH